MPFGAVSTLYLPIAGSAGSSQWGTDVRKLLSAADATADATTQTSHGTSGVTVRTADPFTTSTADLDQSLYGFAITPADMNSVSGAKRFYPAGDHTLTLRMSQTGVTAANPVTTLYAYRVGNAAGSRARTLLGSAANAGINIPGSGESTQTVTLALPEVVFEADETIQYVWETSVIGVAVTGRILTHYTGTRTAVASRIDTPTLRTLADTTGTATGTGTGTGVAGKVLGTDGTATGSGTAAGTGASRADTTGSAAGTGTADGLASSVAGAIGTAAGSGAATGVLAGIGSMTGTAAGAGDAVGVIGGIGGMTGTAAGSGAATGVLGATGGTTGTATGTGTAAAQASSVAGSIGSASGAGSAAGAGGAVVGTIGTVEIGSGAAPPTTTTVRPIFVFDD